MSGRSIKKLVFVGLIVAVAAFGIKQFFFQEEQDSYILEKVERRNIEKVINATGQVKAVELVTVGAQATGKIEKLYVRIGDKVKKGDMIAQIDAKTQINAVETNKAKLNSLQAQLEAAKVTLKVQKSQYERMQRLRAKDAASEEDFENAENAYETAKANVTQLTASIAETKISLKTAETNLGYTKITAPLDGTIVSIPVKEGQTVNSAMNTPTIVQIANLDEMEILIEISEGDIAHITEGTKVTYYILGSKDNIYETTLKQIDPGLTLLTNNSYTGVVGSSEAIYYYGRLVVPNEDGKLRIGMTVQTMIYVANVDDVLAVPVVAVHKEGESSYVDVLTPEGVRKRLIQTGVSDGLMMEVLSGVKEGDEIVLGHMSASQVSDKVNSNMRGRHF